MNFGDTKNKFLIDKQTNQAENSSKSSLKYFVDILKKYKLSHNKFK